MNKNKILLLLALLSAFPPLSTDMYLPAIPLLQKTWNQPLSTLNLTLVGFFVSYCICLLFYGPLSDRFGRRPPLLVGIGIYILASFMCGLSDNVVSLISFRVLQAAGGASASALALAISKDVYQGHERERVLAYIGVIMAMTSFSFGLSRPPSNNLVLEQVDRHAGAASSLLIFIYFMMGAFSMWLISLEWTDKIQLIGLLAVGCGGVILAVWTMVSNKVTAR